MWLGRAAGHGLSAPLPGLAREGVTPIPCANPTIPAPLARLNAPVRPVRPLRIGASGEGIVARKAGAGEWPIS
jgi:hypothetical protein